MFYAKSREAPGAAEVKRAAAPERSERQWAGRLRKSPPDPPLHPKQPFYSSNTC